MYYLSEVEKAYLAGMVDGEGCITILKNKSGKSISPSYTMRVIIAQAGSKGIDWLDNWREKVGLGTVYAKKNGASDKWKGIGSWQISSNQALNFLVTILPYLELKQAEAELAIQFQSTRKADIEGIAFGGHGDHGGLSKEVIEKREVFYLKMQELKNSLGKRGRPRS